MVADEELFDSVIELLVKLKESENTRLVRACKDVLWTLKEELSDSENNNVMEIGKLK